MPIQDMCATAVNLNLIYSRISKFIHSTSTSTAIQTKFSTGRAVYMYILN
eukprot:SAG31_NODE_35820_length_319_cov_1.136364_1_plen_49_part_10